MRKKSPRFAAIALVAVAAEIALAGCAARPRMCAAPSECGALGACVAGRCQRSAGTPAIQAARRVVLDPVAMAYVRRTDPPLHGALPPSFFLGRETDGDARLFLRFALTLPPEATVVEAYVLLERSADVDSDPLPITLHAVRVVDPWDARSISWVNQPRIEETRSPSTTVSAGGRARVRVDVRDLVLRWRFRDRADHGIAIVSGPPTASGMAFAFAPAAPVSRENGGAADPPILAPLGFSPQLEIYVK